MGFEFKPNQDVAAAKYEFVNFLEATPKNIVDYQDMQDILRHRMSYLIRELYGNIRIPPNTAGGVPFSIDNDGGNKRIATDGTWYVDGYRVFMDNQLSDDLIADGTSYFMALYLKFSEVTYEDDHTMALQDAATLNYIPTSTRYKFDVIIKALDQTTYPLTETWNAEIPQEAGYDYMYYIGAMNWNGGTTDWDHVDTATFPMLDTKYDEALAIVNSAVHLEDDDVTATIKRTQTAVGASIAKVTMEEASDNKIGVRFSDESGDVLAAFEMVQDTNTLEWIPVLWMHPGTTTSPLTYIGPDGLHVYDDKGNSTIISDKRIGIGNGYNGFYVDNKELSFLTNSTPAFKITSEVPDGSIGHGTISGDGANTYHDLADPEYTVTNAEFTETPSKQAIFTFPVATANNHAGNLPIDGILRVNHKLVLHANGYEDDAKIDIKVFTNNATPISWQPIQTSRVILRPGNRVDSTPLLIGLADPAALDPAEALDIKIEYYIQDVKGQAVDPIGIVGFLVDNNTEWIKSDVTYPITQTDVIRQGNNLLWTDSDGNLRRIPIANEDSIGTDAAKIKDEVTPIGDNGITIIGPSDFDISSTEIDITGSITKPEFANGVFTFPVANAEGVVGGVLSHDSYLAAIAVAASDGTDITSAQKMCFVSNQWNPAKNSYPYFTTFAAAIDKLAKGTGGTIMVMPGDYSGETEIDITGDWSATNISIVAYDPLRTRVFANLITSVSGCNIYWNVPITGNGNGVITVSNNNNVTMGPLTAAETYSAATAAFTVENGSTLTFQGTYSSRYTLTEGTWYNPDTCFLSNDGSTIDIENAKIDYHGETIGSPMFKISGVVTIRKSHLHDGGNTMFSLDAATQDLYIEDTTMLRDGVAAATFEETVGSAQTITAIGCKADKTNIFGSNITNLPSVNDIQAEDWHLIFPYATIR